MSTLYRWWAALLFLAIVVQVGLAGIGAFRTVKLADDSKFASKHAVEHFFDPHGILGSIIIGLAILLVVFAAVARVGSTRLKWAGALLGLTILQLLLAALGSWKGALGFFHPINALILFAVSGLIAHREWRAGRLAAGAPREPAA
jgi:hypothetical protein